MCFLAVALFWSFCFGRFIYFDSYETIVSAQAAGKGIPIVQFLSPYIVVFALQSFMTYAFFLNPPQTRRDMLLRHGAIFVIVTVIRTVSMQGYIEPAWGLGYWASIIPMLIVMHGIAQLILALIMRQRKKHMQTA